MAPYFKKFLILSLFATNLQAQEYKVPPQDKGLPYTRTSRQFALKKIESQIALFPGSRYAYVYGYKVRLDDTNWKDEAKLHDGILYIPQTFAPLVTPNPIQVPAPPSYLESKWVYEPKRLKINIPNCRKWIYKGKTLIAFEDLAKAQGLQTQKINGLMLAGTQPITFSKNEEALLKSVVTLFDTPEKLANPDIATEYIPTLKQQGKWTDYIKATPAQLALLEGEETEWPFTSSEQYDYKGINTSLFGSKLPKPGIYPRVLFSADDVPMLANRLKKSKLGQMSWLRTEYLLNKTWFDPTTDDGKLFQKLATGDLTNLQWPVSEGMWINDYSNNFKDYKPGIYSTHVGYVPECLSSIALYCLLSNDQVHGQMAAHSIANYYRLREPLLDSLHKMSDGQLGSYDFTDAGVCSSTNTRSTGGPITVNRSNLKASLNKPKPDDHQFRSGGGLLPHMNLGLSLDFAGKWMDSKEKDDMRRIIAKATYGKRAYGQDGPKRFRDVNWMTWDLPLFLGVAAIEGLEGFDKEVYESNVETIKSFCEWGIDKAGVVYESNGKTPGGFQFLFLAMMALARRGENMFAHPHIRNFLTGQIQMTAPSGKVVVNSGTQYVPYSRSIVSLQFIDELKAIYPQDKRADFILSQAKVNYAFTQDAYYQQWILDGFDAIKYKQELPKKTNLRLCSITYPGFGPGFLYDTDFDNVTKGELDLPLNFYDPSHGVFSAYGDTSAQATWINMMVRPDTYLGAGHHHADAGMFHFSALGKDWFTESPFSTTYDGKYHNLAMVDGISEPTTMPGINLGYPAAPSSIGANISKENGACASADLTQSYTYRWQTQPQQVITEENKKMNWEMDPSEQVQKMFAGTSHYRFRPWWPTANYSNYMPTSRCLFNPMQYVYRTVGLTKGSHSYAWVIDDLKKNEKSHLYQWTAMLNGGVWKAKIDGLKPNELVLAQSPADAPANNAPPLEPQKGQELLLVYALGSESLQAPQNAPLMQTKTENGPLDKKGIPQPYDVFTINHFGTEVSYKVLLIPFHYGEPLPIITESKGKATLKWKDQEDTINWKILENRTIITVLRNGKEITSSIF